MRSFAVVRNCLLVLTVVVAAGASAISADAQSTRKKPAVKPIAVTTPTPPAGDAEIISRADDLMNPPVITDSTVIKQPENATDDSAQKIKELNTRIKRLESNKTNEYDEKQKRLLLNLDILTRAEQRADGLRKQLFEMIEKENTIKSRIDQIETDSRPEIINRSATFSGSMKPEEVREQRKKSLDAEKQNLQSLLNEIQLTRAKLTANVQRSDAMVEKLRFKLEKEIDDALNDEPKDQ